MTRLEKVWFLVGVITGVFLSGVALIGYIFLTVKLN